MNSGARGIWGRGQQNIVCDTIMMDPRVYVNTMSKPTACTPPDEP